MTIAAEYNARIDSRGRIVLRDTQYVHYHVLIHNDGRIVLQPRVLVAPPSISRRTLTMIDRSMAALDEGHVPTPADPNALLAK